MEILYFDTETTGVDDDAEIIQFGIVNSHGKVLLDTLIQCEGVISPEAQAVHGITKESLKNAPTWLDAHNAICTVLERADMIKAYNIQFDLRMLRQTAKRHGLKTPHFKKQRCVMKDYAKRFTDNGRWVKLVDACEQQHVNVHDVKAHSAADDCEMTRRLDFSMQRDNPIKSREQEYKKKAGVFTWVIRAIIITAFIYIASWIYIIINV